MNTGSNTNRTEPLTHRRALGAARLVWFDKDGTPCPGGSFWDRVGRTRGRELISCDSDSDRPADSTRGLHVRVLSSRRQASFVCATHCSLRRRPPPRVERKPAGRSARTLTPLASGQRAQPGWPKAKQRPGRQDSVGTLVGLLEGLGPPGHLGTAPLRGESTGDDKGPPRRVSAACPHLLPRAILRRQPTFRGRESKQTKA